jgi:hypothetical protein
MAELTPAGDGADTSARQTSVGSMARITQTLKAWSST